MHEKDVFMFRIRICRFHFETDKVVRIDFVWCDMNDATITHALCIEKNIVYYVISFRKVRKAQCGDAECRITLFEINSIKTDNIDWYIIKRLIIFKNTALNLIYAI